MTFLSMLGLMKVEDHEAVKRVAAADHQALTRMVHERDKALTWAKEQHGCADRYAAELTVMRERFKLATKDLADQADELATFRAKRDRDNAQRRERHARKANDAAPKAKKGVRS